VTRIDLQSHSLHSDGELAPAEVVERAAQAGVELLALSDHDTLGGVDEALAAAREHSIGLIVATEISAVDAGYEDLHVLGFAVDQHDARLLERLRDARDDREHRAERMSGILQGLGFAVDDAPLALRRAAGKPIGRPHLAAAVLDHPDNAARLAAEGHTDVSSFIPAYLIPGAPAYARRTRPTVSEAIEWIHDAGGLAVWAHPFWDVKDEVEVLESLDRYRGAGLDGVECFYVTHDQRQTQLLADRCGALGLISTGSSDYHGPHHRLFSRFLAYELYDREPQLGRLESSGG
jgi:predicted metal-dependent phosphoesterase TrpH